MSGVGNAWAEPLLGAPSAAASLHESKDPAMAPISIKVSDRPGNKHLLDGGAELVHVPAFLPTDERAVLWDESQGYPWAHQTIRGVRTLRANAWFADDARAVYAYSGQRWSPVPLAPSLVALRERLEGAFHERMNSVLATLYPNGNAAVGYHADDEPLFGEDPVVASLSVGATRTFQVVRRDLARSGRACLEVVVKDGDLVIMRGPFQRHYLHALKKSSKSVGERINLSYRRVVPTT